MVSRPTIIKYGTLALILFFIGSSLYPLLYSNNNSADASATPDASALTFTASTETPARIVALGFTGVAFCSPALLPVEQVKRLSNVSNAFYASETLLAVQMNPDSNLNELSSLVASNCQAALFRSAFMEVPSVNLNTSIGNQLLTSRQMLSFAQNQGLPGVQGFVSVVSQLNQSINTSLEVVVQKNVIVSISMQEIAPAVVLSNPLEIIENNTELLPVPENPVHSDALIDSENNGSVNGSTRNSSN